MDENVRLRDLKTFYARRMGLVTVDDDVLSIVRQLKEEYGERVTVEMDPNTGAYHFIEHCEDGTDRLIFSTYRLDPTSLDRVRRADSQSRLYQDPYTAAENEQDALDRLHEEAMRERVRETGEMLAHAFKKDGTMPRLPEKVSLYIPGRNHA